jgi:hypothetical protein
VFVILYEAALMGVRVGVGLPIVSVFVRMLDMLVIMQDVGVRMRHIPMGVFVSVFRGHSTPFLVVPVRRGPPSNAN